MSRTPLLAVALFALILFVFPPSFDGWGDPFPAERGNDIEFVSAGAGYPEPLQSGLAAASPFSYLGHVVQPRAEFHVEARVLHRARYRWDATSDLSPIDLMLGWSAMSENQLLSQLDFWQNDRWGFWRSRGALSVSPRTIEQAYSNFHMIPANDDIERALAKLRAGESVRISGMLVDVDLEGGGQWNTSLSRRDSGGGACEILFATRVQSI